MRIEDTQLKTKFLLKVSMAFCVLGVGKDRKSQFRANARDVTVAMFLRC